MLSCVELAVRKQLMREGNSCCRDCDQFGSTFWTHL